MPADTATRSGWFLEPKTTLLVVAGFALMIVTGLFTQHRFAISEVSSRSVAHTHEMLTRIESVESSLEDAESEQRGYLLTGEEAYLEPYHAALAAVPQQMARLREQTSDNSHQQESLDALESLIAKRLAIFKELTTLRDKNPAVTVPKERLLEGKKVTDEIRAVLGRMKAEEEGLLAQRLDVTTATGRATTLAVIGSAFLNMVTFALAVLLVNRNIAGRLAAEEGLRQSEAKFRRLADSNVIGIGVADYRGRFLQANGALLTMLGYTKEHLLAGRVRWDMTPPESRAADERAIEELRVKGICTPFEKEYVRTDGQRVPALVGAAQLSGSEAAVAFVLDLSERKRMEKALHRAHDELEDRVRERTADLAKANEELQREVEQHKLTQAALRTSEARFRTLIEQSVVGFYVIQDDRYVYVNPKLTDILGFSADEMASRPVLDFIAVEDRPMVADNIRNRLEGTVESVRYHLRMRHKEGRVVHLEAHGTKAEYAGRPAILGVAVDITERKRAEETLQRLAALVASSEDAITGITPSGVITDWNLGAERLFGYTAAEVTGKDICRLIPSEDRAEADRTLERLRRGETIPAYEALRRRKDGSTVVVSVRLSPIMHRNRLVGFSLIYHDLTATKKLEEQLRQAQKMEAVGQLAGGVAHDFNNLLTIISGYSEMVLASLPAGDRNRGLIQEIYKAGERAALLTRQLLAFSRKQVLEPKVLNLNAIVGEAEKMLRRLIGEDVSLIAVLDPGLAAVKVDPGQVEQVVMNLVVNARDAMAQGGKLTIETANVELDESYAQAHFEVKPGRYVMLAVSDTGCGMDEATKARIFEPFFTTKGPSKGTGLGLATVYGIVKQSGGSIGVYSEPGKGSAFKIYLPVVQERIPTGKSHHDLKVALRGSETVLLVEDEPAVRSLSRLALQMYGYRVLEASQGEEALRVGEQHAGPIHLLLTDVVMPGMSGRQVAEAFRQRQPAMKVLFVSGYTDDAVVRHGVLEADTPFLQKPFTPVALANKVREVLDK
jgi:PAS domain S-box-containing protein